MMPMTLGELIAATKGSRSYHDLERDCAGTLKAARWQQIATRPLRAFPDPDSLAAIARSLRVPHRTVILAAATSLGLHTNQDGPLLADLLPPGADRLDDTGIAAVLAVVNALITTDR